MAVEEREYSAPPNELLSLNARCELRAPCSQQSRGFAAGIIRWFAWFSQAVGIAPARGFCGVRTFCKPWRTYTLSCHPQLLTPLRVWKFRRTTREGDRGAACRAEQWELRHAVKPLASREGRLGSTREAFGTGIGPLAARDGCVATWDCAMLGARGGGEQDSGNRRRAVFLASHVWDGPLRFSLGLRWTVPLSRRPAL